MRIRNLKEQTLDNIYAFTISGILIVTFYAVLKNLPAIADTLQKLLKSISPFIFGICVAFVLAPVRRWIEEKVLVTEKIGSRTKRLIAVAVSMLVLLLVLFGFFAILIPQLVSSLSTFVESFGGYVQSIQDMISQWKFPDTEITDAVLNAISQFGTHLTQWLTSAVGGLGKLVSYSISFARGILNFFIGLIIAVYLMMDDEKFKLQCYKFTYALLNRKQAGNVVYVTRLTARMFNSFIFGKALDSLIIGIICWFVLNLMKMPYTPLIAVVVGITNMIPVFGPFLGAIPCIIILLLINPVNALEFMIFILILQQVDGNIIGPRILGDSLGLPTLWVMFAIIVGGAFFGIGGMFLGVPIFSVIYVLMKDFIHQRLKDKNIVIRPAAEK